jgi:DNA-binding protein YbaB
VSTITFEWKGLTVTAEIVVEGATRDYPGDVSCESVEVDEELPDALFEYLEDKLKEAALEAHAQL